MTVGGIAVFFMHSGMYRRRYVGQLEGELVLTGEVEVEVAADAPPRVEFEMDAVVDVESQRPVSHTDSSQEDEETQAKSHAQTKSQAQACAALTPQQRAILRWQKLYTLVRNPGLATLSKDHARDIGGGEMEYGEVKTNRWRVTEEDGDKKCLL